MKTRIIKQGNAYKPQYRSWWKWIDFDRIWYSSMEAAMEFIEEETKKVDVVWESDK